MKLNQGLFNALMLIAIAKYFIDLPHLLYFLIAAVSILWQILVCQNWQIFDKKVHKFGIDFAYP